MTPPPDLRVADDSNERLAHERALEQTPSLAAQWTGMLLAPAVFFAHLQVAYVLVPRACRYHADVWLHVVGGRGRVRQTARGASGMRSGARTKVTDHAVASDRGSCRGRQAGRCCSRCPRST